MQSLQEQGDYITNMQSSTYKYNYFENDVKSDNYYLHDVSLRNALTQNLARQLNTNLFHDGQ